MSHLAMEEVLRMTSLKAIRVELDEVFQPAIRWVTSQPAERQAGDYACAIATTVDLTWGGRWKVSQLRDGETWIVTAVTQVQGHHLSATAKEDDYLFALAELHAALIRRIDRIEEQVRKQQELEAVA